METVTTSLTEQQERYLWTMERSNWKCSKCYIQRGELDPRTRKKARVGVAHIDGDGNNFSWENLVAICQTCLDLQEAGASQMSLFGDQVERSKHGKRTNQASK